MIMQKRSWQHTFQSSNELLDSESELLVQKRIQAKSALINRAVSVQNEISKIEQIPDYLTDLDEEKMKYVETRL